MAYVSNIKDEEEENQPGSEQILSGQSGSIEAGGPVVAPRTGAAAKPKGTGWTNLQQYVSANQGNDARMASGVSDKVSNRAQDAQQTGQTFSSTTNQKVQSGTVNTDDNIIKSINDAPETIVSDQNKRAAFDKQLNASYQGPNSVNEVEGFYDTDTKYNQTKDLANSARTFEGRTSLLNDVYGRSDYTGGEKRLDSFLLGQGGAKPVTENIVKNYGDNSEFTSSWQNLLGGLSSNINQGKATTDATKKITQDTYNSALGNIDSAFKTYNTKAEDTNKINQTTWNTLNTQLASKKPEDRAGAYKTLNVAPEVGEWLVSQGYDAKNLASAAQAMKAGDFANDKEISKIGALYELGGKQLDPNLVAKSDNKSGAAYDANQTAITNAAQAKKIQDDITARLAAEQAKRDSSYQDLMNAVQSFSSGPSSYSADPTSHFKQLSKLTGVSVADLARAADEGIDINQFVAKGKNLNYGDVANTEERSGWSNLMTSLGLSPSRFNVNDSQDEGSAYSFNKDLFNKSLPAIPETSAEIAALTVSDKPQDVKRAYNQVTKLWPPFMKEYFPQDKFASIVNGEAELVKFLSDFAIEVSIMAPANAAQSVKEMSSVLLSSPDPKSVAMNAYSVGSREGGSLSSAFKTGIKTSGGVATNAVDKILAPTPNKWK